MAYYLVKVDMWGIKAGSVERFERHKAAILLLAGDLEPFDRAKHFSAPGAAAAIKAMGGPEVHKAILRPVLTK